MQPSSIMLSGITRCAATIGHVRGQSTHCAAAMGQVMQRTRSQATVLASNHIIPSPNIFIPLHTNSSTLHVSLYASPQSAIYRVFATQRESNQRTNRTQTSYNIWKIATITATSLLLLTGTAALYQYKRQKTQPLSNEMRVVHLRLNLERTRERFQQVALSGNGIETITVSEKATLLNNLRNIYTDWHHLQRFSVLSNHESQTILTWTLFLLSHCVNNKEVSLNICKLALVLQFSELNPHEIQEQLKQCANLEQLQSHLSQAETTTQLMGHFETLHIASTHLLNSSKTDEQSILIARTMGKLCEIHQSINVPQGEQDSSSNPVAGMYDCADRILARIASQESLYFRISLLLQQGILTGSYKILTDALSLFNNSDSSDKLKKLKAMNHFLLAKALHKTLAQASLETRRHIKSECYGHLTDALTLLNQLPGNAKLKAEIQAVRTALVLSAGQPTEKTRM